MLSPQTYYVVKVDIPWVDFNEVLLIFTFQEFDFNALESSTEYDGGFTKDTPCVTWFWETVHGNIYFLSEQILLIVLNRNGLSAKSSNKREEF